jgi:spore coat polysaccharide biosynthesis protein spsC
MRSNVVPFHRYVPDSETLERAVESLKSGWLTSGPQVEALEEQVSNYLDGAHCVAMSSGTAALHAMYATSGLPEGARIGIPVNTFVSSAAMAVHAGFEPVLLDIDAESLLVSSESASQVHTLDGILAVHFAGVTADVTRLTHVARVFEDAAHCPPATLNGVNAGVLGSGAAFSFYATKTVPGGEGGMFVTRDAEIAESARAFASNGLSRRASQRYCGGSWRYDVASFGFKYSMPDVVAAIVGAQMRTHQVSWLRRAAIASRYDEILGGVEEIDTPFRRSGDTNAWHLYVIRLHLGELKVTRDQFIGLLRERGIATSVHFIPLYEFGAFRRYGYGSSEQFPIASYELSRTISLPIWPGMESDQVDYVAKTVRRLCAEHRK